MIIVRFRPNVVTSNIRYLKGFMSILKKLFRWECGRQKTGYSKMLLCGVYWPIKFDIYLLKFPEGSEIPIHRDRIDAGRHFRLNIVLKNAQQGGEFVCSDSLFETERIKLFRPDISEHKVSKIIKGNRYLLSIGWVNK